MDGVELPGVLFTPLRRIAHPKGDVMHAVRASDPGFETFGEAYFTHILPGATKGWKRHDRMVLNLVVPYGQVLFSLWSDEQGLGTSFSIGDVNYGRLTVPAGYWMAFTGEAEMISLILNIASIEYDPGESTNLPLSALPLGGKV